MKLLTKVLYQNMMDTALDNVIGHVSMTVYWQGFHQVHVLVGEEVNWQLQWHIYFQVQHWVDEIGDMK